jgi:ElaB/YqjD/DUF883 family membrane-anchored ribosome-binding protein
MDPLRKEEKVGEEKFEDKRKFEKPKPADISQSGEFKREPDAEYPEPETARRMSVPMGPMPTAVPAKDEAKELHASGPRLVAKESRGAGEAKARYFSETELQELRARWDKIQGAFVDQPRQAVEDADNLVGEAIKKLSEQLAGERSSVTRQWNSGDNVSTEILRQSLRRYRTFFEKLLAA